MNSLTIKQAKQIIKFISESLNLVSTVNLKSLLKRVMETAISLMKAETGSLMLVDEEKGELNFQVILGEGEATLEKLSLKIGDGIAGWVAREGKPLIVNDTSIESRFDPKIDKITGYATKSIICVPLIVRGRVVGVIEVLNKKEENGFTKKDLSLLQMFSSLAALLMENSRLYNRIQSIFLDEVQNQIIHLTTLSEISGVIMSGLDFQNLFKSLIELLLNIAELEAGVIFRVEENKNLSPVVSRGFHQKKGGELKKQKFNLALNIAQEVLKSEKPFKVENFFEDKNVPSEFQVALGLPIIVEDNWQGVLVVFSHKGTQISSELIEFLKRFSFKIALFMEKIKNIFTVTDASAKKDVSKKMQYKAVLDTLPIGILTIDEGSNIDIMNRAAETMLGLAWKELQGQNVLECHSSLIKEQVESLIKRFISGETSFAQIRKHIRTENKILKAKLYPIIIKDKFKGILMTLEEGDDIEKL